MRVGEQVGDVFFRVIQLANDDESGTSSGNGGGTSGSGSGVTWIWWSVVDWSNDLTVGGHNSYSGHGTAVTTDGDTEYTSLAGQAHGSDAGSGTVSVDDAIGTIDDQGNSTSGSGGAGWTSSAHDQYNAHYSLAQGTTGTWSYGSSLNAWSTLPFSHQNGASLGNSSSSRSGTVDLATDPDDVHALSPVGLGWQAGAASDHAVNQARQWEEAAPGTGMLAGVVNSIPTQLSGAFGSLAGMTAADTALVTQLSDKLPEYTAPETAIGAARLTNPVSVAEREAQLDQSASHTAIGTPEAERNEVPPTVSTTLSATVLEAAAPNYQKPAGVAENQIEAEGAGDGKTDAVIQPVRSTEQLAAPVKAPSVTVGGVALSASDATKWDLFVEYAEEQGVWSTLRAWATANPNLVLALMSRKNGSGAWVVDNLVPLLKAGWTIVSRDVESGTGYEIDAQQKRISLDTLSVGWTTTTFYDTATQAEALVRAFTDPGFVKAFSLYLAGAPIQITIV